MCPFLNSYNEEQTMTMGKLTVAEKKARAISESKNDSSHKAARKARKMYRKKNAAVKAYNKAYYRKNKETILKRQAAKRKK